jgi:CRISPR/Cas system-associated protein Csm6
MQLTCAAQHPRRAKALPTVQLKPGISHESQNVKNALHLAGSLKWQRFINFIYDLFNDAVII